MLKSLSIRNFALIQTLDVSFDGTCNIITGETGSGKSLIIKALKLLTGARVDKKTIQVESQKTIVEGVFFNDSTAVHTVLSTHELLDLDAPNEIIIRREILKSGKSRSFVNDTPVTLQVLNEVGGNLIQLHQQFDTRDLGNSDFQMALIDALADNRDCLLKYKKCLLHFNQIKNQILDLELKKTNSLAEYDFMKFQFDELESLGLVPLEEVSLEQNINKIENSESAQIALQEIVYIYDEKEGSINELLNEVTSKLGGLLNYSEEINSAAKHYNAAKEDLLDSLQSLSGLDINVEYDAAEIKRLTNRFDLINRLLRKHKVQTVSELIAISADFHERLSDVDNFDDKLQELRELESKALEKLERAYSKLFKRRKAIVLPFTTKVKKLLASLSMANSEFDVVFAENTGGQFMESGKHAIDFFFSANKGFSTKPLSSVASGGELSRLALCVKSVSAEKLDFPSLVFDEIDSGVSGEVALKMASLIKDLSESHQITVITHTPQVASLKGTHLKVSKRVNGGKQQSLVEVLSKDKREKELAEMLSGKDFTKSALENARELLSKID